MKKLLADLEIVRARRDVPLFAERVIAEPDIYEPQGPIAKGALPQLRKLLDLRARGAES